ncbi:hypothetical protein ACTXT7_002458 [Hymenolepis weldensis]
MIRHVSQDHGAVARPERAKLNCPVTDCHKQYKVRGWLNKYLQSCHPEVTSTASGRREQPSRAATLLPPAGRGKVFGEFVPKRASKTTDMRNTTLQLLEVHQLVKAERREPPNQHGLEVTAALPTNQLSSRDKSRPSTEMPHPFSTVFIP